MARKRDDLPRHRAMQLINRLLLSIVIVLTCGSDTASRGLLVAAICPAKCHCGQDLKVLCSAAGLNVVPITLNPRIEELDLSNNEINKFGTSDAFAVYPNLRRLDVSQNAIRALPDNGFQKQQRLEVRTEPSRTEPSPAAFCHSHVAEAIAHCV